MALNKVNYVDNQTIITAQNLNNIQDSIINLENDLAKGKQDPITVSSSTNASKRLSKGTVTAITSISVEAGTYLVCANATFPAYRSLEPAKYTHMLCVNTSTSFDHGKATAVGNVDGMQNALNVSPVVTLASAGTIYMLGYAAAASTVTNGNLYAIKIG